MGLFPLEHEVDVVGVGLVEVEEDFVPAQAHRVREGDATRLAEVAHVLPGRHLVEVLTFFTPKEALKLLHIKCQIIISKFFYYSTIIGE